MTDQELRSRAEVLGTLSDDHPVWFELCQILDEDIEAAQEVLARADLSDGVRHFQAGYLAHVLDLQRNLDQWRAQGMQGG